MGKKLNAIRVGDTIEKVSIDFSSLESIRKSSNFGRLYTIHTAKTIEMSRALGFHVGGFCDDRGYGGSPLAAELSDYEYLPSDLILCLMDEQYNFLPLNEKQLDIFYTYLTTGKVVSANAIDETEAFFEKHHINPVLPEFGIKPRITIFEPVIALVYDLSFENKTDKEIAKVGEQLFHYSSNLVDRFTRVGEVLLSPNGDYYLLNRRDNESGSYIVLIQAIEEKGQPEKLTKTLNVVLQVLNEKE